MDATNIDSYFGDLMDHWQSCHLAGCLELTSACQNPQLHLSFAGCHRPSSYPWVSSLLLSVPEGTITSSNQKPGILRGVALLTEMSGGLQKHNEITKFLSNIFS